jgi:hypothetical protein
MSSTSSSFEENDEEEKEEVETATRHSPSSSNVSVMRYIPSAEPEHRTTRPSKIPFEKKVDPRIRFDRAGDVKEDVVGILRGTFEGNRRKVTLFRSQKERKTDHLFFRG